MKNDSSQHLIAVIGPAECEPFVATMAYEVGRGIAGMGAALLCGGRTGVMEAACRGAQESGGVTIGLLPGADRSEGNGHLSIALPTNLGHARNALIAQGADVVIAIGGGYGTLSEIAFALKLGKRVVGLATWEIPGVHAVARPKDALEHAAEVLARMISL